MTDERAAKLREMMRGPPPPLPPMPAWHCLNRPACDVKRLVNYMDGDGKSCYRAPWPEEDRT